MNPTFLFFIRAQRKRRRAGEEDGINRPFLDNRKGSMEKVVRCQALIRGYLVRKNILLAPSKYQTKQWRKIQNWYITGKYTECEKYQYELIQKITNKKITKTGDRINLETLEIKYLPNPLLRADGFEWSENFDGKQIFNENVIFYYNLKFVCDRGGAQLRTLREAYHFLKAQLQLLVDNVYFINILDGDESNRNMKFFSYLMEEYDNPDNVFCGDMYSFQRWFRNIGLTKKLDYDIMAELSEKRKLGQYYTINNEYILQGLELPSSSSIIEPFAGNGDLLSIVPEAKRDRVECYDIDPKQDYIVERDTLLHPPNYKGKFVLTNPPFLARNKSKDKSIYDKYAVNDLYKCFLKQLMEEPSKSPVGGIVILPLNFWSSNRKADVKLREDFFTNFEVLRVNVFEEQVFPDTSSTVCSLSFKRGSSIEKEIRMYLFPERKTTKFIRYVPSKCNLFMPGGEIFLLDKSKYKIGRLTRGNDPFRTNILAKCIDDNANNPISLSIVSDDKIYVDNTVKSSARCYATLSVEPALTMTQQKRLVLLFNEYLNSHRKKYSSLFLTNYRESKDIARKRMGFELMYSIVSHLLMKNF